MSQQTSWNQNRLLQLRKSGKIPSHSLGWFQWVCDTFEILPGHKWGATGEAVYEGNLVNYALFLGSVEILRWLMEEKGCELNKDTGKWAGVSGSVEVLEYLEGRGYEFDKWACARAAKAGRLEALQYLNQMALSYFGIFLILQLFLFLKNQAWWIGFVQTL